jgi:hypothetical protein
MVSRPALSKVYGSEHKEFFCTRLGISDAPPRLLASELEAFCSQLGNTPISASEQCRILEYLRDIGAALSRSRPLNPKDLAAISKLTDLSVFPTHDDTTQGTVLATLADCFIPDNVGKYANIFRGKVALLDAGKDLLPIKKLLASDIFRPHARLIEDHVTSTPLFKREEAAFDYKLSQMLGAGVVYIRR